MTPGKAYTAGRRDYGKPSPELITQIDRIVPTHADGIIYRPCRAILRDGRTIDRVLLADAQEFIDCWGMWPGDDVRKASIDHNDIVQLEESPDRLPPEFAEVLYREGESGMGYLAFVVTFADGAWSAYVSGNVVDFIAYPAGLSRRDVSGVVAHQRRHKATRCPDYHWCLIGEGNVAKVTLEPSFDRERVANDLHPVAITQARDRFILLCVMTMAFLSLLAAAWPALSFGTLASGVFVAFGITTAPAEFRWWRWLRRTEPVQALDKIESRIWWMGGLVRTVVIAIAAAAAFLLLG